MQLFFKKHKICKLYTSQKIFYRSVFVYVMTNESIFIKKTFTNYFFGRPVRITLLLVLHSNTVLESF